MPEALAATAEPVLFGLLGAAAAPLVGLDDIWVGVALTLATLALVAAAGRARLHRRDRRSTARSGRSSGAAG